MASQEAVILGAGITGILTAHALLEDGWKVTVLDAAHIGAGSSSRTAAGIRQQFSTPDTVRAMRYCVSFYRSFTERMKCSDTPIVQNGYLFLVDTEEKMAQARRRVAMQQSVGLAEVEALDRDELVRRFPWIEPDAVMGGTWCPTDGFLLPHIVYHDGAEATRALGGTIQQGTLVTGANHSGGRITEVLTNRGSVGADLFLDCTNAWTRRTGHLLGGSELEVAPLKRYLWFLQREGSLSPQALDDMPLTILPSGLYVRPENSDTLLMGRKHDARPDWSFDHDDQDTIDSAFSHNAGLDAAPFEHWMELAEFVPPVGEFGGITATSCGYYGTTPDHNPFLDYDPNVDNLIRLVGFSGHGAMLAPFTAQVATRLARAGQSVADLQIEGHAVSLNPFAIGRSHDVHESLVI